MSRKSYRTSAREQKRSEQTYPDAHVTVRRACDAIVRERGRAGELMDGTNVVLCLSFCRQVSRARRRSTARTVLGAARLFQVPHDEIAVPRARQDLVAVICRDLSPLSGPRCEKEHPLPLHHATSVLALSILSPLPSQRFLARSARCPVAVSSGSAKRRTRKAARHRRQERPDGK